MVEIGTRKPAQAVHVFMIVRVQSGQAAMEPQNFDPNDTVSAKVPSTMH